MITDLKPYPEYKDSGLPWLGQVPRHWEVVPSKSLFGHRKERARTDDQMLTASQAHGIIARDEFMAIEGRKVMHVFTGSDILKHVEPNDFVMSMRSFQGGLEWSKVRGAISSAYVMLIPTVHVHPPYYAHLLKSAPYIVALRRTSDLVRDGQALRYANFGQVPLPRVPKIEQAAIVRFLDWANGRLKRTIRGKRKMIALLNEQKQAIIHRAVTRGLDPNVALKPSGIPWLGDIPAHWELWRISRFARVGNGSTPSRGKPVYWNGGTYPWLNSSQVKRDTIESADQFVTTSALRECHLPIVPAGSILVAITGQGKTRGMSALLRIEATINQHIAFIAPRIPVASPEFICLGLKAAYLQLRALSEDSGSTKGAITCEDLKRFKLAIPPETEQTELLRVVENETRTLSAAISRLEREIELLREYRTRLVADVVTGKLDIREMAAQLPEEVATESTENFEEFNDEVATADDLEQTQS